jgi:hypothetical protein
MQYWFSSLGAEATRKAVMESYGEVGDDDLKGLNTIVWTFATNPVYNDADRNALKPGEACFNISKNPKEVLETLMRTGIMPSPRKTLQISMYPVRYPVCRINLPPTL